MESTITNVWTKQQIDKELRELSVGIREAGDIDYNMIYDLAISWLSENPGARAGIEKHYNTENVVGFVADKMC